MQTFRTIGENACMVEKDGDGKDVIVGVPKGSIFEYENGAYKYGEKVFPVSITQHVKNIMNKQLELVDIDNIELNMVKGNCCSLCGSNKTQSLKKDNGDYILWCSCGNVDVRDEGEVKRIYNL